MIVGTDRLATSGLSSPYGDRTDTAKGKPRDFGLWARGYKCEDCGAKPGQPCVRKTVAGPLPMMYSHVDRGWESVHKVPIKRRGQR